MQDSALLTPVAGTVGLNFLGLAVADWVNVLMCVYLLALLVFKAISFATHVVKENKNDCSKKQAECNAQRPSVPASKDA